MFVGVRMVEPVWIVPSHLTVHTIMFVGARMVEPVWMVHSHLSVHVQPTTMEFIVNVRHMLHISHFNGPVRLLIEHSLMGKNMLNTRMAPM